MADTAAATGRARSAPAALLFEALRLAESVPYWFLALPLRVGVAWIFWNSAMVKLINWQTTLTMFSEDYQVPILPPELAANMALLIELVCPPLLVFGLLTRASVVVLLGMTAVIQIFVYPEAWPTHLQWTAMMLVLLCRGPGKVSFDHFLWRWIRPKLS